MLGTNKNDLQLDLLLSDYCTSLFNNQIPLDTIFTNYRDIFMTEAIHQQYPSYIPFKLIVKMREIVGYNIINGNCTQEQGYSLIYNTLTQISKNINPLDVDFYFAFIKATMSFNTDHNTGLEVKMVLFQDCLDRINNNTGSFDNITFEIEFYNILLKMYINESIAGQYSEKLKNTTEKLRELVSIKDSMEQDLFRIRI